MTLDNQLIINQITCVIRKFLAVSRSLITNIILFYMHLHRAPCPCELSAKCCRSKMSLLQKDGNVRTICTSKIKVVVYITIYMRCGQNFSLTIRNRLCACRRKKKIHQCPFKIPDMSRFATCYDVFLSLKPFDIFVCELVKLRKFRFSLSPPPNSFICHNR